MFFLKSFQTFENFAITENLQKLKQQQKIY